MYYASTLPRLHTGEFIYRIGGQISLIQTPQYIQKNNPKHILIEQKTDTGRTSYWESFITGRVGDTNISGSTNGCGLCSVLTIST